LSDHDASGEALGQNGVDFSKLFRKGMPLILPFPVPNNNEHDCLYWRTHQLVIPDHQGLLSSCLETPQDAPWERQLGRNKTIALVASLY
jgi:hypothetical protein